MYLKGNAISLSIFAIVDESKDSKKQDDQAKTSAGADKNSPGTFLVTFIVFSSNTFHKNLIHDKYPFFIFTVSQDRLACLLSGKGVGDGRSNTARDTTPRGRSKRAASSSEEPKYGCPKDFTKVTEYLCLYSHNNSDGIATPLKFEEAKTFCKDKDEKATLLYFANAAEAKTVWDWLGKNYNVPNDVD